MGNVGTIGVVELVVDVVIVGTVVVVVDAVGGPVIVIGGLIVVVVVNGGVAVGFVGVCVGGEPVDGLRINGNNSGMCHHDRCSCLKFYLVLVGGAVFVVGIAVLVVGDCVGSSGLVVVDVAIKLNG